MSGVEVDGQAATVALRATDGVEVDAADPAPRLLCEIAEEIRAVWRPPFYGAVPYLNAMARLGPLSDTYGADSARSVVAYFLTNAGRWHGPTAQRIKAELREMTGQ